MKTEPVHFPLIAFCLLFTTFVVSPAWTQSLLPVLSAMDVHDSVTSGTTNWHYQVSGSLMSDEGFSVLPTATALSFNSAYDYGFNDRSWWQGRGFNAFFAGGVAFSLGPVRGVVAPEFTFTQNQDYPIREARAGDPTFGNYYVAIDAPQRFGDDPIVDVSPGQTHLELSWRGFGVTAGTNTIKLGPGRLNNLVLSDNAPGYPNLVAGTTEPLNTPIGVFDVRAWWGRLSESDYFDSDSENNYNLMVGGTFMYAPPGDSGLSLGLHRNIVSPWETMELYEVFQLFETPLKNLRSRTDAEDDTDQIFSVWIQLYKPELGLRVYLEWGRNDHANSLYDLIMNPEHTRAYVTGMDYAIPTSLPFEVLLSGEITVINPTPTATMRGAFPWYRHNGSGKGYTNEGQYLGAWIGSGANGQFLSLDLVSDIWSAGVFVQRTVFDNDFLYRTMPDAGSFGFNVQMGGGAKGEIQLGQHRLSTVLRFDQHIHRWWQGDNQPLNIRLVVGHQYRY